MRIFVRGVLIGLVASAPYGFRLNIHKFSRYLVASIEEVGNSLHELEAEGILQYEQDGDHIAVWSSGYTEENVERRIGFRRETFVERNDLA